MLIEEIRTMSLIDVFRVITASTPRLVHLPGRKYVLFGAGVRPGTRVRAWN